MSRIVSMYLLILFTINSAMLLKLTAFSIPMISIESPKLQILPKRYTGEERHQLLMNISLSRMATYNISNSYTELFQGGLWQKLSSYYVVQLFFGTSNPFNPFLLLDTASVKTWIQCEGCNPCFELKGGNIDVRKSLSYKHMSVNDPRCKPRYTYVSGICGFMISYIGGQSVKGPVGTDTFMFIDTLTQKPTLLFENVAFGCGVENNNIWFGLNTGAQNEIAGVFGLAPGPLSFINQLDAHVQGKFMYCLISLAEPEPYTHESTINFGAEANIQEPNVQHIKLHVEKQYHLYFRGISVGGNRLPIDSDVCPLGSDSGFIIDSGAPMTYLPPIAYQILRAAMVNYFAKFGWHPVEGLERGLCYLNSPKQGQSFPTLIFHFANVNQEGEVDWVMDKNNVFLPFQDKDGFCMMIKQTQPGLCLFGAFQHTNFKVLYDVKNGVLSFAPHNC